MHHLERDDAQVAIARDLRDYCSSPLPVTDSAAKQEEVGRWGKLCSTVLVERGNG